MTDVDPSSPLCVMIYFIEELSLRLTVRSAALPTGFTETELILSPQTAVILSMQSVISTTEKAWAKPFPSMAVLTAAGVRSMKNRASAAAQAKPAAIHIPAVLLLLPSSLPEGLLHPVEIDQGFALGGMEVRPFAISHDANEPSGFRIENGKKAVAVATDLGMYDGYTVENLKGLNGVVLEANHDIHMLEVGPYPYPLKRRVMGDKGHLSNEWSGRLLCDILHDGLQYVVLGHLSKENNYAELAYETVKLEVSMGDNPYRGEDIPMMVAKRDSVSQVITL